MSRASVFRAEWVLPVATPPIYRGEILVGADGRIAAVAPAGAVDLPSDAVIHDFGEAVLLPGLVNVHAHPELAMFRGALEDLPFREWILRLVGTKRSALLPEDSLAAAKWTMVECLRAGITTVAATEASGAAATALTDSGLRGIVYQEVFGPDPAQVDSSITQLREQVQALMPLASDRVRIGVSPHAPYTVSDALYRATVGLAAAEKLPIALHVAESVAERDLVVSGSGDFAPGLRTRGIETRPRGRTPIEMLQRLGVLEHKPLLIHCVDLDDEDIAAIAAADCPVAHCPVANAKLGHGVARVTELRGAGVRVGLGTDSVGSNNRLDLLEEARFASLLQRVRSLSPETLAANELLRLCTIDGARALGLDADIGTLEPGKYADLCAVSIDAPHAVPAYDPAVALFHSARGTDVMMTVVGGQVLYNRGEILTLDVEEARDGIVAASERLRASR